jgi:ABC-type sugar transport system permease subunit
LDDDLWWLALENTIKFTAMTVIGTTVVALAAALTVTQKIRGQQFFRVLLYIPSLMSVGAVGLI